MAEQAALQLIYQNAVNKSTHLSIHQRVSNDCLNYQEVKTFDDSDILNDILRNLERWKKD